MFSLLSVKQSWIVWIWLVIVYFLSGLIINMVQLLLLPLWFISRNLSRQINAVLCYSHWSMLTFAGEWWGNLDIIFYGKKKDYDMIGKEHCLVLANHRSDIDWLVGWILCERYGTLGTAKCYMKGYLKYLPVIGWMWWFSEYVFLKRKWDADHLVIKRSLEQIKDYPIPVFLGIFPEGTRFTLAKHANSLQFAESRGFPPLQHHLFPRTKGVSITLTYLKDMITAVYDLESAYPQENQATMKQLLSGGRCETHLLMRRIPIEDIPCNSEEEISEWCRNLFVEKDKIMSDFVRDGKFSANRVDVPRKHRNLIIVLLWNVVLAFPILYALFSLLNCGLSVSIPVFVAVSLIGYISVRVLLRFSDSTKGSKFGLATQNGKAAREEKNGPSHAGDKKDD